METKQLLTSTTSAEKDAISNVLREATQQKKKESEERMRLVNERSDRVSYPLQKKRRGEIKNLSLPSYCAILKALNIERIGMEKNPKVSLKISICNFRGLKIQKLEEIKNVLHYITFLRYYRHFWYVSLSLKREVSHINTLHTAHHISTLS